MHSICLTTIKIKLLLSPFLVLLPALLLLFGPGSPALAQQVDQSKVTVSYTYNFAKNIRWPNESRLSEFSIGLFQVDDSSLVREFRKLDKSASLKGVPIKVAQVSRIEDLSNYDVIYVGTTDNSVISRIQNRIEGQPVLMVTSGYKNQRLVMINLFATADKKIQFEVNKANIINNQLTPLPELILLGGTEIDVAKLYREGQTSLVNIQNRLAEKQQQLEARAIKLNQQQQRINDQQTALSRLQGQISTQRRTNDQLLKQTETLNSEISNIEKVNKALSVELKNLNTTIAESKRTITEQQDEIARINQQKTTLVNQVAERNKELDQQQAQLEARQQQLDNISDIINSKEYELVQLNETIGQQAIELQEQRNSIDELDKLVAAQKRSLYFLWGLVITGTALFFIAIYAYRTKRRDNERLARRSHELQIATDKLEIAKRKAEEANRTKGAFLSLMSHELRTPLQSIIGYSDLMIEEMKLDDNIGYIDQLARINTNGERLLQLINNTLDLAKIEAGKMDVELSRINIGSLVEEATGNVRPLLGGNNNTLTINIDNKLNSPEVDYAKLLHILVNLLSNANKFTHDGQITVTVKNTPNMLSLTVSDTGIGLDETQLTSIFDRFHQVNKGNTKTTKGTGLGLSITQHFCELMGGSIRAESQKAQQPQLENPGSDFIVEIPLPVVITARQVSDISDPQQNTGTTGAAA